MKKTFHPLITAVALIAASLACAQEKPNILLILADDLGYADVGFHGSEDIPTPNIDRIAAEGVRCTDAYVTYPVCAPSRAGLITGRQPQRFGFERNPALDDTDPTIGLDRSEITLADYLKQAGYATGCIGKWHLGEHPSLRPNARGFDYYYGFTAGGHDYFPGEYAKDRAAGRKNAYNTPLLRNGEPVEETGYLTDILTREGLDFIRRNQEKPFFLFMSYNAPHTPLQASQEYLDRFKHIKDKKRRTYAAMVSALDDGTGALLDLIEELDLQEDTLIFFLSDNGGPTYTNASSNKPLRGTKSHLYEGGVRVPFAVAWPGTLPAGTVYRKPISSMDIMATALALAGVEPDPTRPLDGVNLIPYLTGQSDSTPHETLWWRKFDQEAFAIRHGNLKLVRFKSPEANLYDLGEDLTESNPLDEQQPEKAEELYARWTEIETEMIEPAFPSRRQHRNKNKDE